jgi:hypothetical protein
MSRFFTDAINSLVGGRPYFIYTIIRNAKESDRRRKESDELISSLSQKESNATCELLKAKIKCENLDRLKTAERKKEMQYLLERNGYKTFEEFISDSQIKTRAEWERFANSTRFFLFNDEYKKLHPEQYE